MTISVIMSVYDKEQPSFLDEAINSIWTAQICRPNEIVIVEDGTLNSKLQEILHKWKAVIGDRMIILKNEENMGLAKSLNKAIEASKGDYLARMDSDDVSLPDRFKIQQEYLDAHPETDVLGGAIHEFNMHNECLNVRHYPTTHEDSVKYIYKASPVAHPTVMMRRELFDKGLYYKSDYGSNEDIALWFDVICSGYHIANLDDVILKFRRSDDMFKRRTRSKAIGEFKAYMNGIRRYYGLFNFKYIYPIMRLSFRLLPTGMVKWIYSSGLRKAVLE